MEEPCQIPGELWARIERLVPPLSAYAIAPVAQRFTQAGSPPHRSQMTARPLSGCRASTPKGHASTHAEQPLQSSGRSRTAPVLSSLYKASVGQLAMQGGRLHRRQTCGSSRPWRSTLVIRKRAEDVPKRPSCLATQATIQARHPLHNSLRTIILFTVSLFSLRLHFQTCLLLHPTCSNWETYAGTPCRPPRDCRRECQRTHPDASLIHLEQQHSAQRRATARSYPPRTWGAW